MVVTSLTDASLWWPSTPTSLAQPMPWGRPPHHYKAITFVCGLRLRGVVAPKAYDRAMTAETFEAWLEHHLLPTLEEGDIVVQGHPAKARRANRRRPDRRSRRMRPTLQPARM